jgi:hypothetical protein
MVANKSFPNNASQISHKSMNHLLKIGTKIKLKYLVSVYKIIIETSGCE